MFFRLNNTLNPLFKENGLKSFHSMMVYRFEQSIVEFSTLLAHEEKNWHSRTSSLLALKKEKAGKENVTILEICSSLNDANSYCSGVF